MPLKFPALYLAEEPTLEKQSVTVVPPATRCMQHMVRRRRSLASSSRGDVEKEAGTLPVPVIVHNTSSLVTTGAVVVVVAIIAGGTLHRSQLSAENAQSEIVRSQLDGGWHTDMKLKTLLETAADGRHYPTPCTIPRLPWSEDVWPEDWPPPRTPVIFTNYTSGWPAGERWTKRGLREEPYSALDVQASTPAGSLLEHEGKAGSSPPDISLRSFIDRMEQEPHLPWYVFERRRALRDVLLADIEIPLPFGGPKAALAGSPWNHLFLSLGGSRAGALFHAHAPAWNALIFGKKRWLLFDERLIAERHAPLIRAFREMAKPASINHSNADFLTTVYRTPEFQKWWGSHGYECIQEAGEMLYIPDRFYHAILNLGEAVAVIGEFCAEGPGCIPTSSAGKGICRESVHCAMCLPTCQQHFGCVVGSTQPRSPLCDRYQT